MKLTPWYPPHINPVRVGWYHTNAFDRFGTPLRRPSAFNWWWDGFFWKEYPAAIQICRNQSRTWRGLARKPK